MKSRYLNRLARRLGSQREAHSRYVREHSPAPEDYDGVFSSFLRGLPKLVAEVERNKRLAEKRYADLADGPEGRRAVVIRNSRPSTLVAFTHRLLDESFAERFTDVRRSLRLARLGCRTATAIAGTDYLSAQSMSDLLAEAHLYLGNALRLNSDSSGAEAAFEDAEKLIDVGTRDRVLRAKLHSFRASLRMRQRRASEAVADLDREIALRQLLHDRQGEATALVNRGIMSCHAGDLREACSYLRRGTLLTEDQDLTHLALLNLATGLARRGRGLEAWTVLSRIELIPPLPEGNVLVTLFRWTKGLAFSCFEQHSRAERELRAVRETLIEQGRRHFAGAAAVDLACVLAAKGSYEEVAALASEAYQLFAAERLDRRVLEVLILLRKAADSQSLTAEFAARVADFVARSRYDRDVEFEHTVP